MRLKARKMFPVGLGFGLALAGIGAAVLWLQEYPDTSRVSTAVVVNQSTDPAKHVAPEDIEVLKTEIERLKSGRRDLERLSAETKSELTSLRDKIAQTHLEQSTVPASDEAGDAPTLTPEAEQERAEAQTRAQVELIEGILRGERTDLEWANTAQLALSTTFHSEAMTGIQLVEAECRTSLCRMRLSLDGSTTPEDSFRKLVHSAPWQGQGFAQIDGESGEAVVYLAREGYAFPQLRE